MSEYSICLPFQYSALQLSMLYNFPLFVVPYTWICCGEILGNTVARARGVLDHKLFTQIR